MNRVELRRISNEAALRKLQTRRKGRQVNARPSDLIFFLQDLSFPSADIPSIREFGDKCH